MLFILPAKYTSVDQVPIPTEPQITIKAIPEQLVAVLKFNGATDRAHCLKKLVKLYGQLKADHLLDNETEPAAPEGTATIEPKTPAAPETTPTATSAATPAESAAVPTAPAAPAPAPGPTPDEIADQLSWLVATYSAPFALPYFKRNEVWVELDADESTALAALVQQHADEKREKQEKADKEAAEKLKAKEATEAAAAATATIKAPPGTESVSAEAPPAAVAVDSASSSASEATAGPKKSVDE